MLEGHTGSVEDVAFAPDSRRLASAGRDASVLLWDFGRGGSRNLVGHRNDLAHVAFAPDGRWLAASSILVRWNAGQQDLTVRLWNAATGEI